MARENDKEIGEGSFGGSKGKAKQSATFVLRQVVFMEEEPP